MAQQSQRTRFELMGWNAQGDLGGLTFYVSRRGRLVFFDKAPPLSPPSALQISQRDQFRQAAKLWRDLTPERRQAWHQAEYSAHLGITGYNLFVFWVTMHADAAIRTIEQRTGLQLIG